MLLVGPLLSQTDQREPFSFKDDKLGMSLEGFKAKHVDPGEWENEITGVTSGGDSHRPPRGRWKWKPYLNCRESFKGVITQCRYTATVAGTFVGADTVFVEGKLAVIIVTYTTQSSLIPQALVDKFGPPVRVPVSGASNRDLSALRWDNGASVVEFQEHYCGSLEWSKDVTEMLRGSYCDDGDAGDYGLAYIWYVHKSLANLAMARSKEAIEEAKKREASERFSFDRELGMSLREFKSKLNSEDTISGRPPDRACKETAKTITECVYMARVLSGGATANAIFVDNKLAAICITYLDPAMFSRTREPIIMGQRLIDSFGPAEVIPGVGHSGLPGDSHHALHWDDGVSIVEYQEHDCMGENEYEKINKILQKRYCEKAEYGYDGLRSNIIHIHKALSGLLMERWKEAKEDARKKARSDM